MNKDKLKENTNKNISKNTNINTNTSINTNEKINTNKNTKRIILAVIIVSFVLSLIPMYVIGLYAHPSVDDYYYGDVTRQVWNNTHSIFAVIKASFEEMKVTYNEWQGNFSAIFLMRLQPGVFGEKYYAISPFILITAYVICSLFFFYTALTRIFHSDKYRAVILAVCTTFVSMQLVETPSDSFYWFNGSIYYTFFYSMMLLLFSLMIIMSTETSYKADIAYEGVEDYDRKKSAKKKWLSGRIGTVLSGIISVVLAFFIGGSNFSTALFTTIITSLCAMYVIFARLMKKNKNYSLLCMVMFCLILASILVGMFISITAPGNEIRKQADGKDVGLVLTFAYTFTYAAYSLARAFSAPVMVFFICITPILYHIAKRMNFSFKYPLLVLIFTFGLYSSQGTPVFYAQGLRMPYRMMNIIYFSTYSFVGFNLLYFLGFISRRFKDAKLIVALENFADEMKNNKKAMVIGLIICVFVFFCTCVGRITVTETESKSGKAAFSDMTTSMAAAYSLITKEAKVYDIEMTMRDEYLSTSMLSDDVVAPLTAYPNLIFRVDITTDPGDWHNAHVAKFYHKNTVRLQE